MLDNTEFNEEDFIKGFSDLDIDTEVIEPVVKKESTEETVIEEPTAEVIEIKEESTEVEPTIYSGIVDLVKEEAGLFSAFESKNITDATQLVEAIKSEVNEGIEDWKNSLPEELKHIVANYEEGVSLRDLIELQSNQVELDSITDDDLEDKDLQKKVYTQYLKSTTKFSDSKIEKEINKLDDLDELQEEAKNALEELKESTKAEKEEYIAKSKAEKLAYEKEQKQRIEDLKKDVLATQEIIPGVKLNTKEQETLFKQLTQPVAFDKEGNPISKVQEIRAKDPVFFEKTLNYLVMKGVFEKDYSLFKTVEAKGKTKAITELEKLASRNIREIGKAPSRMSITSESILNAL